MYNNLMNAINKMSDDGSNDQEVQELIYSYNIKLSNKNARNIAYPCSQYRQYVIDWKNQQRKASGYICDICKKVINNDNDVTIDHNPPLSVRFNKEEYLMTREQREDSYNDTSRMRILCRSCNSRIGGANYDWEKIALIQYD